MDPPLWNEGASPWPHEREALAFVRSLLPNHEPYRAWSNVEFIADDGSVNEVDLLVVTTQGFFLVEIKAYDGILFGDSQQWRHRLPDGREKLRDHPLLLANLKAKRLKSLLVRQPALKGQRSLFVTALIFLSSPSLDCRLHAIGRTAVCGRDETPQPIGPPARAAAATAFAPLPGIVAALKAPGTASLRGHAVNRPLSAAIATALEQAKVRPSNRGRKVGDWDLGELLDEGPGWQDFAAARPRLRADRRVRIYLSGAATTDEGASRLRREAEHEFRLVQDLRHDGIAQPLDLVQAERGPALLFDRTDGEERLDLWVPNHLTDHQLDARIELVRQLGEALAHAHAHGVQHRALTARSILVRESTEGPPRLVIGHWQAGARDLATRLTKHSTDGGVADLAVADLTERLSAAEQVYLAPELLAVDAPAGVPVDVFSLGSLAHLLLSGQPPAADLTEREEMLAAHHGLALGAAVDGLPDELVTFVACATDPVPARRPPVRELLDLLDDALDTLTAPHQTDGTGTTEVVDPLAAHQGAVLEGGWQVRRRLGSGSTAVALLCERPGDLTPDVLKVAKDEAYAERLRNEARALENLRHPGIVELRGLDQIGGRTTLRLAPAGDPVDRLGLTLADRLRAQGRLGLDQLDRFGDDLLDAVAYLEQMGVPHRDIKPDNLGVRPRGANDELHLVLFDFSLTRTPDTNLQAGTPGYLDPFLAERPGKRWDPAADRYAAAATLHEMATGVRPSWGDGQTNPLHLADQRPALDAELFDPSVRDRLLSFFNRALHRSPTERFDTAVEMRLAWRKVFVAAARPVTTTDEGPPDAALLDALADAASPDTPVAELGLTGAATSALERLGLGTVQQLLAFPTAEWNRAPGIGDRVRREVLDAIVRLRDRLDAEPGDPAASIDHLARQLIPKASTQQPPEEEAALRFLLGLDGGSDLRFDDFSVVTNPSLGWPGPMDVKAHTGLDRGAFDALVDRARRRWAKQPAMTQVRHDVASLLERAGGVQSGDDMALALLAQRGSTATGPARLGRARAVVRAALETEAARSTNRFTWRRLGGGTAAIVALRSDELEAEELADYAASLGLAADMLAGRDPLPSPAAALEQLRQVPVPAGLNPLPDNRLVRLAAAASATTAVSGRLELYPRGLAADRAVRLARASLLGSGTLSEADVRSRVSTRFPEASDLPARPGLDELLQEAVGLIWVAGSSAAGLPTPAGYRVPPPPRPDPSTAIGNSGTRYRTGQSVDVPDEERAEADVAQDRLERHAKRGGYLVITVTPDRYQRATDLLTTLGATPTSMDEVIITALRGHAAERHIDWERAILAADAEGPSGARWPRLLAVVRNTLDGVRAALLHGDEHRLVTNPGLLARYDALGLLDDLRERTTRQPEAGQSLRTLWVLVPTPDPAALPTIQGKALPVTTTAERLALPPAWLGNLHRTRPKGATS